MRRCLIIDDSPLIRKVAHLVLEQMRFTVDEAESGVDALAACKKAMPDFILLDWHLPGMSAYEFLSQLKRIVSGSKPYVIYSTTENDPLDISKAVQAGCEDVMLKPFTRADLEAKLNGLSAAA